MAQGSQPSDQVLRTALETNGHRFTEQRAAVFRYLSSTTSHPTADEVYSNVREKIPVISLATVYKSLETLVGCGLAAKLTYGDGSARYDGRTDPHHHARCLSCSRIVDVPGEVATDELEELHENTGTFQVTGYRLEFTGYCADCSDAEHEAGVARA